MVSNKIKLYKTAKNYFKGPDGMKNEVLMWFIAGGLFMNELSKKIGNIPFGGLREKTGISQNKKIKEIEILDLCSGPGNFSNHLSFICPAIKPTCVDVNKNFIKEGQKIFKNWKFINTDATSIKFDKKFDFIVISSAYHHIEDSLKPKFLKNVFDNLNDDGTIIMCDNFIPDYKNATEKTNSIKQYYNELQKYYKKGGNATTDSIEAIREVRLLELSNQVEYKVSFRLFQNQLRKSNLKIETDIVVWQPDKFIKSNAGSHALILKLF